MTADRAEDLWTVHEDEAVAEWYGWTRDDALQRARDWGAAWADGGFHKWLEYERSTGELVGRGGVSRIRTDAADGRAIHELVPEWDGVEIGWALRSPFWGRGYATEIGRAGLDLAFGLTDVVVAFTETHNARSRAVMERLTMTFAGEFVDADGLRFAVYTITRAEWADGNRS